MGQSQIGATPLHMAMVAASIATNDGVMMEPRLLVRVQSPAGAVRLRYSQKVYRRTVSTEIAKTLQSYMLNVAASGTTSAARVTGLTIAGKTGSVKPPSTVQM